MRRNYVTEVMDFRYAGDAEQVGRRHPFILVPVGESEAALVLVKLCSTRES
jgi:hypothetical protein